VKRGKRTGPSESVSVRDRAANPRPNERLESAALRSRQLSLLLSLKGQTTEVVKLVCVFLGLCLLSQDVLGLVFACVRSEGGVR
jgi:hypothetical protein